MTIRRADEKKDEKTTILRVTIPKRLLEDIRETKKACAKHGFVFDIKPDVEAALERAVFEAKKALEAAAPGKA